MRNNEYNPEGSFLDYFTHKKHRVTNRQKGGPRRFVRYSAAVLLVGLLSFFGYLQWDIRDRLMKIQYANTGDLDMFDDELQNELNRIDSRLNDIDTNLDDIWSRLTDIYIQTR